MLSTNTNNKKLIYDISRILNKAEQTPEIKAALDRSQCDQARRDELRAALGQAEALVAVQETAYQTKIALTQTLTESRETLDETFALHRKLMRIFLKDDEAAQYKLGLDQHRQRKLPAWLNQGEKFYGGLRNDPTLEAAALRYKLDTKALDQTLTRLGKIRRVYEERQQARKNAKLATKTRDKAIGELALQFTEFKAVARQALKDQPQYLAALELGV